MFITNLVFTHLVIPPVARQGSLPEIMQTTSPLAQPYTGSHVTVSRQASASLWGIPPSCATGKMQPVWIFVEFDVADAVFTTILLLAISSPWPGLSTCRNYSTSSS